MPGRSACALAAIAGVAAVSFSLAFWTLRRRVSRD